MLELEWLREDPNQIIDDYMGDWADDLTEEQRDDLRNTAFEYDCSGNRWVSLLDSEDFAFRTKVVRHCISTPSGLNWQKVTPSKRYPEPALRAEVGDCVAEFWIMAPVNGSDPAISITVVDENGKRYSSEKSEEWPGVEKLVPRKFWPIQAEPHNGKAATYTDPAFIDAINAYWEACASPVDSVLADLEDRFTESGEEDWGEFLELAQGDYRMEPHTGVIYRLP